MMVMKLGELFISGHQSSGVATVAELGEGGKQGARLCITEASIHVRPQGPTPLRQVVWGSIKPPKIDISDCLR